jgi:PII-like signaling protein
VKLIQEAKNLFRLTRFGMVNCFLVREEDGLTLVDTGLAGSTVGILRAARTLDSSICRIVLTHATVLRGVAGYGGSSVYHTDKILRLSQDLPIVLEVIESTERIEEILPCLDEMVEGGLITLEKVRVILYRAAKK